MNSIINAWAVRAAKFRMKANDARKMAEASTSSDPILAVLLFDLARDYDELAKLADSKGGKHKCSGPSSPPPLNS